LFTVSAYPAGMVNKLTDATAPDRPRGLPARLRHGRGAVDNQASNRFDALAVEPDGALWDEALGAGTLGNGDELAPLVTHVSLEKPRTVITRNQSPDLPFDRSLNAYRGCEHGCIYCYARPTHAYLGLSPGLDFETRLTAKPDAAALLEAELARPGYEPAVLALGTNTDPYQPVEQRFGITRAVLAVLEACRHPVSITTKSHRVTRDADILGRMAADKLALVNVSVTTLDPRLARTMEPRAATPARRIDAIGVLAGAGVPVNVFVSPLIPAINDHEIETILEAAAQAGARGASAIVLRLPHEVKGLFRAWLDVHFPERAARVMALVRQMRGARDNDPAFGSRMEGTGAYAAQLRDRFRLACQRFGLNVTPLELDTSRFRPPPDRQYRLL